MKRFSLICVAALLIATLQTTRAQQSSAEIEKQLARAHHKATVDGDLAGAIEEYKRIVAAATSNRTAAAQALVLMAECYQKLGNAESRKIYERLVRDYADQKESAAIARARLGGEGSHVPTMTLRKVWDGPNISSEECAVSSDGRYITCPAWETGDLGLHDVVTGADRLLTTNNWAGNQFAQGSAISKDGKHVAYAWFDGKRYELRVTGIDASNTKPRTILNSEDIDYLVPTDWTPDGEFVVTRVFRRDHTAQIGVVGVKDGSLRILKTTDWAGPQGLFLSPDGRYIAFDLTVDDSNSNERDIFVLAIDGRRELPAVVRPGRDIMMGWAPDGRNLLFASDRGGAPGLWSLRILDGRPVGEAALVKSEIAPASLGISRNGALFVIAHAGIRDVHVAEIDVEGKKLVGTPASAVRGVVGRSIHPVWSRDGRHLAYVSQRSGRNPVIVIRSLETDTIREVNVAMNYFGPMDWAPDGRSFLVKGQLKGVRGLYQIDAQTGQTTRLSFEEGVCAGAPQFSPDGKKIYFFAGSDCPGRAGSSLLEGDMATGNLREIVRGPGPNNNLALSPDGRFFAGERSEGESPSKAVSVVLIPVNGDKITELLRLPEGQSVSSWGVSWAPDGRNVLVTTRGKGASEILVVPADGGPAVKLQGQTGAAVGGAKLHPNGRQVAFSTGEYKAEVWVLDNFLSVVSAAK